MFLFHNPLAPEKDREERPPEPDEHIRRLIELRENGLSFSVAANATRQP
ncbi:MAG: hypothetical protein HY319_20550 [Armatimonadetes bacterium]|nr:hypothetical protein [Armatimonadota bacterium]